MGKGNGKNAAQMHFDENELILTPEPVRRRRSGEGYPVPGNPQAIHAWQYLRVDVNNNNSTHYGSLPTPVTPKAPGRHLRHENPDELMVTPPARHSSRRWMRSPLSDDAATSTTPSLGGSGEKHIMRAAAEEGLTVELQNSLVMSMSQDQDNDATQTQNTQSQSESSSQKRSFEDVQSSSSSSATITTKSQKTTSAIDLHAFFALLRRSECDNVGPKTGQTGM